MSTTRHLFVYGTLMTSASGAAMGTGQRARLHAASKSLGAATIPGRLYDAGRYPLLVDSKEPGDIVHGEVLSLDEPAMVFPFLDPYEGIDPARPDDGMYRRVVRTVTLHDGSARDAWVYLYQRDVSRRRRIADGRWRP
jgi:gamma-glutamylcyclotransferase (GGCT)/AIG2-like uncharacterized protein YtfP